MSQSLLSLLRFPGRCPLSRQRGGSCPHHACPLGARSKPGGGGDNKGHREPRAGPTLPRPTTRPLTPCHPRLPTPRAAAGPGPNGASCGLALHWGVGGTVFFGKRMPRPATAESDAGTTVLWPFVGSKCGCRRWPRGDSHPPRGAGSWRSSSFLEQQRLCDAASARPHTHPAPSSRGG